MDALSASAASRIAPLRLPLTRPGREGTDRAERQEQQRADQLLPDIRGHGGGQQHQRQPGAGERMREHAVHGGENQHQHADDDQPIDLNRTRGQRVDTDDAADQPACSAPGSLDTSLSHAAGLIEIAACHA